jgi:hypothetical protein
MLDKLLPLFVKGKDQESLKQNKHGGFKGKSRGKGTQTEDVINFLAYTLFILFLIF